MAIDIQIKNLDIKGNTRLLNNATLQGPASINLDNIAISGDSVILDNLNITDFCNAIKGTYSQMSASEQASIEKVLAQKENTKSSFIKTLRQHLVNFSEGVAAGVVANWLPR